MSDRRRSLPARLAVAVLRRVPQRQREQVLRRVASITPVATRVLGAEDTLARLSQVDDESLDRMVARFVNDPPDQAAVGRLLRALGDGIPFEMWERHGWHLTANHFYSPIPDTLSLPDSIWKEPSELPGIDMREQAQVELLEQAGERWAEEFNALPRTSVEPGHYFVDNGAFESVDAEMYWSLIRTNRPKLILEIGAGWSTLLADRAMAANEADGHPGRILSIEPYPYEFVRDAAERSSRIDLQVAPLQSFSPDTFARLQAGDILFIDSSHVCKVGSDVHYEILELLPRVNPGVLVHVHDIFLPEDYPRDWVLGPEHRFWNEQYVLQAFLAFNRDFEVVWGSSFMHNRHPELLERTIASYEPTSRHPGSIWLRRAQGTR
jgi:predicted O-methyltransferase YrrM